MLEFNTSQNVEISTIEPTTQESESPARSATILSQVYVLIQNARILVKHGEFQLALNLLRQASSYQCHEVILRDLAHVLIKLERWNEAQKVGEQWHKMSVGFDSAYCKAQIEYQLGLDEQSLQTYFESLSYVQDTRTELFEIFKNIGNIYVRKGDFESSEEFYNKAHAVNSQSDILYVNYGILEMQRGDLNRAKDRFRSAVNLNPGNDKAWVGLAMVHFEFGDEDLGIANLKKALDIAPFNKTAIHFVLQKMNHRRHGEYVVEVLENYLAQEEFDEEISCQLIQKFHELGRYELALIESHRLLLWAPEKPEYLRLVRELTQQNQSIHKPVPEKRVS